MRSPHALAAAAVALALATTAAGDVTRAAEAPWVWASEAASPRPVDASTLTDREADLQSACGRGDEGLRAVATRLVDRKLHDLPYLDADALSQLQRVAGEPHVWPRAWIVSGRALDHDATRQRLAAWGRTFREPGERRCGVALGFDPAGNEVVAALVVDAAADLAPLPIRVRTGAWLPIDARLLVPASAARVVLVGPAGRPRTVPSRLDGDHVRAQVALDQPGAFTVQVVAELASGPRPVLDAELFADVPPYSQPPDPHAPGEEARDPSDPSDRGTLLAMIGALREAEGLRPLRDDPKLDALALAHATRMRQAHSVAHDVGDGDPVQRFEAAQVVARETGENVAHNESLPLAHRALFDSPSHRANLISSGFDRVGVGVLRDANGGVWVTEEFAGGAP